MKRPPPIKIELTIQPDKTEDNQDIELCTVNCLLALLSYGDYRVTAAKTDGEDLIL